MTQILIVDDEQALAETIAAHLGQEGFEVLFAHDGESALKQTRSARPELLILDLMLPKVTGWEVCRTLRQDPQYYSDAPVSILVLTARSEESDKVAALELGADDYLVKPFGMRELVARVRALLRRHNHPDSAPVHAHLHVGPVRLDTASHEVQVQDPGGATREVKLSLKEFELLHFLLANSGRLLPRHRLLERVWGRKFCNDQRTLDVHIRWLREKIEADPSRPQHILTVRKVGYIFKT